MSFIVQSLRGSQFYFVRRVGSAQVAYHETPPKSTKRIKKLKVQSAKCDDEWKKCIISRLHDEYESDRLRYSAKQNAITARSRIVSFVRDKRLLHMLSYATQYAMSVKRNDPLLYDNELFAVVLKFAALHYEENWLADSRWTSSNDASLLFHNLANFVNSLNLYGDDSKTALMLVVDWMFRWATLPLNSEKKDIAQLTLALRQNVMSLISNWNPVFNPMLFTKLEFSKVCEISLQFFCGNIIEKNYNNAGYDVKSSNLVDKLKKPVCDDKYLGSPFVLPNQTEEDFMCLFREQLALENETSVKTKNFCRSSRFEPMEQLIAKWRWKESIAKCLKRKLSEMGDMQLKSFLRNIDVNECAEKLLDCIHAAMCKGQFLISLHEIELNVCRVVLSMVQKSFLQSIACESHENFIKVFGDYVKYYTNDEIASKYTIREWWSKCAVLHDLKYDFYAPFSDLFSHPPTQLANVLISVIMESCYLPSLSYAPHSNFYTKFKKNRTKAFSYRNVMSDEESVLLIGADKKTVIHKMISLHPKLISKIEAHQFENLMFPCNLLPMKVPPRPWTDGGSCGPLYTRPQDILRNLYDFRHVNVNNELKKRLKKRSDARPVFDALNDLGATPWIINKSMLKNLLKAFYFADDSSKVDVLATLSIPRHPNTIKIPDFTQIFGAETRVVDIAIEKWREFSKTQYEAQKLRNELYSLWCSLLYRLLLAKHYENDCLYFPHNMDFRGRVYPISPHLNHMGDDINRGILKFARGKPLGINGFRWLKLHCVNMTGHVKREPIEKRLLYAEEKLDSIIDSAVYPFDGKGWWLKSEEPWQTLAACIEIRDALESGNPSEFISHLPIHQDGSCNGLQHYAALGRDYDGGNEVNLVPSAVPMDVYSSVAARVENKRLEHEQSLDEKVRELALDLRQHMPQPVPRKVIKQTVMTTVYGVTFFGANQQIRRQLKALNFSIDKCLKFAPYLTKQTFLSLDEAFTNSMRLKKWFQNCALGTVQLFQPIQWVTPLGLPVVQPYVEAVKRFDMLCLSPIRHKQTNAFPPNFVHSLDSTHMMLTTLHCRQHGITFAAVHDCFWTHACDVEEMNRVCREQFISLHSEPIIENFAQFLQNTYLTDELRQTLPSDEFAKYKKMFKSDLKMGNLEIGAIAGSIYFFS